MIKVLFIVNASRSLSRTSMEAMRLAERSELLVCETVQTKRAKDAVHLAQTGTQNGVNYIIAVGGDGTCNEVLNGIVLSKNPNVIMGIIPNGTGNDFHRMLPTFTPENFVKLIESNQFSKIDILEVRTSNEKQYALNIAGGGFDGFVVNMLNTQREKLNLGGKVSYALAILRSFILYRKPHVKLKSQDFEYEGKCLLVAACNGTTFGHGLIINPKANLESGVIGVTLMGNVTLLDYLKYLGKLKKGVEIKHEKVKYFETTRLKIEAQNALLFSQVDGEYLSNESIEVNVIPSTLNFLK